MKSIIFFIALFALFFTMPYNPVIASVDPPPAPVVSFIQNDIQLPISPAEFTEVKNFFMNIQSSGYPLKTEIDIHFYFKLISNKYVEKQFKNRQARYGFMYRAGRK